MKNNLIPTASYELRNKIKRDMLIVKNFAGYGNGDHCGVVSFKDSHRKLLEECINWKKILDIFYRTSYNGGKVERIGRFIGVKPMKIHLYSVEFAITSYEDISWKDWFISEGETDAPKLTT